MENKSWSSVLRDPQYIIAIAVAIISICALVVSVRQTAIMSEQRELMQKQAQAAVWPHIELTISKSHSLADRRISDYNILVSNAGVGPAIISGMRVSFDGDPAEDWWDLFQKFTLPDSVNTYISNTQVNRTVLKAGDGMKALSLSRNKPLAQEFYNNSTKIKIEIIYESIYGDRWKYTLSPEEEKTESLKDDDKIPDSEQFNG